MKDYEPNKEWAVYESMTDSYRGIFLSSQSILLAVGAVTLQTTTLLTAFIAIAAILQIWYIWFRILYVRSQISDYHKYAMNKRFDKAGNPRGGDADPADYLSEHVYVRNRAVRARVHTNMTAAWERKEKFTTLRLTRIKLDIIIPVFMTAIWVSFVLFHVL